MHSPSVHILRAVRNIGLLASVLLAAAAPALADTPLHQRIDEKIAAALPDFAARAAPLAGDEEFLRRLYLDLTGTIPTRDEARQFLSDTSADKRARLIEQLLASPRFARHMQQVFDVLWMERRPDKYVKDGPWRQYLFDSFASNKPYDQMVREILSADGSDARTRPAARFYLDREGEPNQITKDISRLFLGMNLQCAQCHDHPLVDAYKQEHYYGIFAFFNRSYLFTDKAKKVSLLAEKAVGEVSFQSVFKPKVSRETGPKLPDGMLLKEPAFPKGQEYLQKPDKSKAGVPRYSRRSQLAERLASSDNVRFQRTAANRFWALFLGRGIIEPVDYDHPDNPPSHPELLDLLAHEFAAMKFDIKALVRQLALSQTYQRSSQMPSSKDLPPENSFALAQTRPLSPEQLAWATMQAVGLTDAERLALGKKASEAALNVRLSKYVDNFARVFGGEPGDPDDLGFQATLDQTLFLRHGDLLRGWLAPRNGNLVFRLSQFKDKAAIAEELFLSVLTRRPSAEEAQDVARFLNEHAGERTAALQELAWALLASAEFRFNH